MGWGGGSSAWGARVAKPRDDGQRDLLRPALEDIIDLGHPLARLAREIDWGFLDQRFSSVCTPGEGRPPLPTRLVAGLFILKHMHNLSDEVLCASLAGEPVLPVLLRRIELLPPAAVRPLVVDALAPAPGRRAARGSGPGEPVGGAQDRGAGDARPRAGGGRHHGAAKGDRPSDRRAAVPSRVGEAGRARQTQRRAVAPELPARGQARGDHGRALHPRAPVQAGAARAQVPAHPAWAG